MNLSPKLLCCLGAVLLVGTVRAQEVTYERLLNPEREPQNWLTFSGNYRGWRYSLLDQITPANARNLELKWVFQAQTTQRVEATPLVVDGVMYVVQAPNDVVALDARTGRVFWIYQYRVPSDAFGPCCGLNNRGLAILGNTLYMGTIDAHLVAIDAKTGQQIWDTPVADYTQRYSFTEAPLVVKDKVMIGVAGAEAGIRGFIAAYSAETGREVWKFNTIPGPDEPNFGTWPGETWRRGGGSSWTTGTYDPDLNIVIWGTGNPWPDFDFELREGDNLYSDSALALDANTGKLKWYFQFTPNDSADWDSSEVPVLADMPMNGANRRVVYLANRNGFFYVLDRATGQFVRGNAFVKQNWATGLDPNGRPIRAPNMRASPGGTLTFPGSQGGTSWYSPSYSPHTGLFYVSAWEDYGVYFSKGVAGVEGGRGSGFPRSTMPTITRGPINTWTENIAHGEVKAIDPKTGEQKWAFKMNDVTDAGVLTTASDVLFTGNREGFFFVLDARNGNLLWKLNAGGQASSTPITYSVDGKQYVSMSCGRAVFVFGLRD